MKKNILILLSAALLLCAALFSGCEKGGPGGTALADFTGAVLEDKTFVYDGEAHSLQVSGSLPSGTDITYENNGKTDAGAYTVKAALSKEGYKPLELTAVLTIEKAAFPSDIALKSERVVYDGKPHSLEVSGSLPEGTDVAYENNGKTEAGTYTVTATLSNPNYIAKTLQATLEIYTLAQAAGEVLADVLDRPDPWSFLPEAMSPEQMAYPALPANTFDRETNVNEIGKRAVGKQLNVLYDGLGKADAALTAANAVFTAGEAIASVYQNFIDKNPDDADRFTGTAEIGGISFRLRITVEGERVTLLAGNGSVSAELISDRSAAASFRNEGRIQLTDGIALKYQMSETALKLAVRFTVNGIGITQQIDFERSGGAVLGSFYEFYGTGGASVKTSALLYSDEEITAVLSDKRISDDMPIDAFAEVYRSTTGELLGGEVTETIAAVNYDTLWFNLYDISGIRSVRAAKDTEGDDNTKNPHIIYINGADTPFVPEYNTLFGVKTSRHYDIEMREVWYFAAKTENGETVYEKVKTKIPMLFVQRENADDFSAEVMKNNENLQNAALPSPLRTLITDTFDTYGDRYADLKEKVTFDDVFAYIGENDSFFDAA